MLSKDMWNAYNENVEKIDVKILSGIRMYAFSSNAFISTIILHTNVNVNLM